MLKIENAGCFNRRVDAMRIPWRGAKIAKMHELMEEF
jgi:hypothetical protein